MPEKQDVAVYCLSYGNGKVYYGHIPSITWWGGMKMVQVMMVIEATLAMPNVTVVRSHLLGIGLACEFAVCQSWYHCRVFVILL